MLFCVYFVTPFNFAIFSIEHLHLYLWFSICSGIRELEKKKNENKIQYPCFIVLYLFAFLIKL